MTDTIEVPTATDWGVADLDLDAYLRRIDHPRVDPTAESLRSLHIAHVRSIPFENIDVVLGAHPGIAVDTVAAKLVARSRGGYCFEHATLFAAAATQLGFTIRRRLARVAPHRSGPRTHMLLIATVGADEYLVDVGYGASIWQPIPLVDGIEVDQAGWKRRMEATALGWRMWTPTPDGWEPDHEFEDLPHRPVDFEIGHHYAATGPQSPFLDKVIAKRLEDGVSHRLIGTTHTTERPDGHKTASEIPKTAIPNVLADTFGIELTPTETTALMTKLA